MGAAVAAIIIRKEKDLVAHFRAAGAISPATALTPEALGVHQRIAWERLVIRAVIREAAPGSFYLDEPSWVALRRTRQRLAIVMVVIVVAVAAFVFFLSPRAAP
jgi:hypothetical protein